MLNFDRDARSQAGMNKYVLSCFEQNRQLIEELPVIARYVTIDQGSETIGLGEGLLKGSFLDPVRQQGLKPPEVQPLMASAGGAQERTHCQFMIAGKTDSVEVGGRGQQMVDDLS